VTKLEDYPHWLLKMEPKGLSILVHLTVNSVRCRCHSSQHYSVSSAPLPHGVISICLQPRIKWICNCFYSLRTVGRHGSIAVDSRTVKITTNVLLSKVTGRNEWVSQHSLYFNYCSLCHLSQNTFKLGSIPRRRPRKAYWHNARIWLKIEQQDFNPNQN